MRKLAQDGLRYHLDSSGSLVPDFPAPELAKDPNVTNWFPKIVRADPKELAGAKKDGAAFAKKANNNLVVQIPKGDGVRRCPDGMTTFLSFSKEAFAAFSSIKQFHPDSKTSNDPATIIGDPSVRSIRRQSPTIRNTISASRSRTRFTRSG